MRLTAAILVALAAFARRAEAQVPADMAAIPAGAYEPLYRAPGEARIAVAAFAIDREPVTAGAFLAFVRTHPAWRRDVLRPVFAERGYLGDWPAPLDAGDPRRPVTAVSWFAARAYCAASGRRLPTVDEWEYVAAASETARDATRDPAFVRRLLALYASRRTDGPAAPGFRNAYGVRGLHGGPWEWTLDFNSVLVADDSRALGAGGDERDHGLFCASAAIGATDPSNYPAFLRYAFRAGLSGRTTARTLGFRCAIDLPAA